MVSSEELLAIAERNQGDFLLGTLLGGDATVEEHAGCTVVRLDTGVEVPQGEGGVVFMIGVMASVLKKSKEGDVTV